MKDELRDNVWALYHEIFNKAIINTEYNENYNNKIVTHGISDENFIRGEVPMTKEEVRSIPEEKEEERKKTNDSEIIDT